MPVDCLYIHHGADFNTFKIAAADNYVNSRVTYDLFFH